MSTYTRVRSLLESSPSADYARPLVYAAPTAWESTATKQEYHRIVASAGTVYTVPLANITQVQCAIIANESTRFAMASYWVVKTYWVSGAGTITFNNAIPDTITSSATPFDEPPSRFDVGDYVSVTGSTGNDAIVVDLLITAVTSNTLTLSTSSTVANGADAAAVTFISRRKVHVLIPPGGSVVIGGYTGTLTPDIITGTNSVTAATATIELELGQQGTGTATLDCWLLGN